MKVLIVSDATRFALTDVFNGYIHAFEQLKIPFEIYPYHLATAWVAPEVTANMYHSIALNKDKAFTHVMFIGGLNIPDYIFRSLYHIKSVVVATEDPHSWDPMKRKLKDIDYYFSNERSVGNCDRFDNTYYCPTAGSDKECGRVPLHALDDKFKSDILFLGALYPNRQRLMESLIPLVEKHNLTFKICGHVHYMPKKSPLWKYVFDGTTIPHADTVRYYNGAKIVLNILRDIRWNPRTKSKKNPHNRGRFPAESLNPRAYEVPLCQSFMLLEDSRPEARQIFTSEEVGFFNDEKSLVRQVKHFLIGAGASKREDMLVKAYKKVARNHTYVHRLRYIQKILEADTDS